jgi:hypothetical protein
LAFAYSASGTPPVTAQVDGLELTIAVHKEQFLQTEPVVLAIRLNNPTGSKKPVALLQNPWQPLMKFTIRDPSGKSRVRVLAGERSVATEHQGLVGADKVLRITSTETYPVTVLHPKTAVTYRELLHYTNQKGGWMLFDQPGRYEIQAHLPEIPALHQETLDSNQLAITVVEPPESEKNAWSSFRGDGPMGNSAFVQEPISGLAIAEALRGMVQEFPQSVYSEHARYALGKFYLNSGAYDDSLAMLEDLAKRNPDFPLRVEVRYYIARANYLKGIRLFQDLIGQHPNWVGSRKAERVLLHGMDP